MKKIDKHFDQQVVNTTENVIDANRTEVSVIVPTYRRDRELKRALQTLAEQQFSDFEIIVVDDNAEAEWNRIVETVLAQTRKAYPFLNIIYIQNSSTLGSAEARNAGVRKAQGKYITFLDDDDEYLPEKIAAQWGFMEKENLDYSITDLALYFENGQLSERRSRSYIKKIDRQSLLEYHYKHHLTATDAMMFTKAYMETIGGFPPINVGDEFYLMERAIEEDGKFGYLNNCDVRAYVHMGTESLSSGKRKIDGENMLYEHKKKQFHRFSAKTIRYIRMRHYSVLAFAGLRMRKWGYFFRCGVVAVLSSPLQCVKMLSQLRQ